MNHAVDVVADVQIPFPSRYPDAEAFAGEDAGISAVLSGIITAPRNAPELATPSFRKGVPPLKHTLRLFLADLSRYATPYTLKRTSSKSPMR